MLHFLYNTIPGRAMLKVLTRPELSARAGRYLDSESSKWLIRPFIFCNGINMSEYVQEDYHCFNDFFCRHIRPELRPIDRRENALIAPCDGLLTVYRIENGLIIPVKESRYSVSDLLRDEKLAASYEGGWCMVFRLCVNHYHRYCYPDSGRKSENIFLSGLLHTVRPEAKRSVPVFTENCREYTVLDTDHFGKLVQMEVGAMLVGKIENYLGEGTFDRGEEKGRFLYGGSTVILLAEKDRIRLPKKLLERSAAGMETSVKLGHRIAASIS